VYAVDTPNLGCQVVEQFGTVPPQDNGDEAEEVEDASQQAGWGWVAILVDSASDGLSQEQISLSHGH
jgi:hypothetical protein